LRVFWGLISSKSLGFGWSFKRGSLLGVPRTHSIGKAAKSHREYYEEGWSPSFLLNDAIVSQSDHRW